MFAPHHQTSADELVRVVRPGGRIGLVNWTPEGFIGQMFATMKPYAPAPPPGAQPPPLWGKEEHVRELLGDRVTDVVADAQTRDRSTSSPPARSSATTSRPSTARPSRSTSRSPTNPNGPPPSTGSSPTWATGSTGRRLDEVGVPAPHRPPRADRVSRVCTLDRRRTSFETGQRVSAGVGCGTCRSTWPRMPTSGSWAGSPSPWPTSSSSTPACAGPAGARRRVRAGRADRAAGRPAGRRLGGGVDPSAPFVEAARAAVPRHRRTPGAGGGPAVRRRRVRRARWRSWSCTS